VRRELDLAQRSHLERPAALFLRDRGVVAEVDLGVEAARQHPLVLFDKNIVDPYVGKAQARQ
jgi:hypothetical protein